MSRLGFLLIVILLLASFSGGFVLNEYIKPTLPAVGPVTVIGQWDDEMGALFCFDEESFENLGNLLVEMGEQFQDHE